MSTKWTCAVCGKLHDSLPMSFAADYPDMYANMDRNSRDTRTIIGSDQCVIDQTWFFIRGCLEIPIIGSKDPFLWGLWVSVLEEVYDQISDYWEVEGREHSQGPFKGRVANSLSIYAGTLNLKCELLIQPVGTRPLLKLLEDWHPLTAEQRNGITPDRALELAGLLLHQEK